MRYFRKHTLPRYVVLWTLLAPLAPALTRQGAAGPPPRRPRGEEAEAGVARRDTAAGSSCEGSEGQWNCMTDSWQRCAAGQWSAVRQCAEDTVCTPGGLTYDFRMEFEDGGGGSSTSGSAGTAGAAAAAAGDLVGWRLLGMLGGLGIVLVVV